MSEGVVYKLQEDLASTETPHLILASIFSELFNRKFRTTEWARLGRLLKIYGRWIVLQAFLLSASNTTFDASKNPWGYFSTICINILNDDRENIKATRLQNQQTNSTMQHIQTMYESATGKYTLKVKEECLS